MLWHLLSEGFLHLRFGGLIFGGLSEFYTFVLHCCRAANNSRLLDNGRPKFALIKSQQWSDIMSGQFFGRLLTIISEKIYEQTLKCMNASCNHEVAKSFLSNDQTGTYQDRYWNLHLSKHQQKISQVVMVNKIIYNITLHYSQTYIKQTPCITVKMTLPLPLNKVFD